MCVRGGERGRDRGGCAPPAQSHRHGSRLRQTARRSGPPSALLGTAPPHPPLHGCSLGSSPVKTLSSRNLLGESAPQALSFQGCVTCRLEQYKDDTRMTQDCLPVSNSADLCTAHRDKLVTEVTDSVSLCAFRETCYRVQGCTYPPCAGPHLLCKY